MLDIGSFEVLPFNESEAILFYEGINHYYITKEYDNEICEDVFYLTWESIEDESGEVIEHPVVKFHFLSSAINFIERKEKM